LMLFLNLSKNWKVILNNSIKLNKRIWKLRSN
jgi:hypothetical protein